mmetsp:Transcript_28534/g.46834  ORF Transcript_28534/g.46834 Transcript_28534/m.46834 type:complete len:216 (-) Transcript_28534:189-836(-)
MHFGLDMITKDRLWIGHWPHHSFGLMGVVEKLHERCKDKYSNNRSHNDDGHEVDNDGKHEIDIELDESDTSDVNDSDAESETSESDAVDGDVHAFVDVELSANEVKLIQKRTKHKYTPLFVYDVENKKLIANVEVNVHLCGDGYPSSHMIHSNITLLSLHLADWPAGLTQSLMAYWLTCMTTLKESSYRLHKMIAEYGQEMDELERAVGLPSKSI